MVVESQRASASRDDELLGQRRSDATDRTRAGTDVSHPHAFTGQDDYSGGCRAELL